MRICLEHFFKNINFAAPISERAQLEILEKVLLLRKNCGLKHILEHKKKIPFSVVTRRDRAILVGRRRSTKLKIM